MKHAVIPALLLLVSGLLPLPLAAAEWQPGQCALPARSLELSNLPADAIQIEAGESELWQDGSARFSGDVSLQRGSSRLQAEQLTLSQDRNQFEAEGGIRLDNELMGVTSEKLHADRAAGTATLENSQYQFYGRQGRGQAKRLTVDDARNIKLEQGSFTTCPPDNHSWLLEAETLTIDQASQQGELHDGWLYAYDLPVVYLPYFTFPVGDQRKSGLLYPQLSSSGSNGFEYAQPIYFNIAPDLDATLTPELMTQRGLLLGSEFRFLTASQRGRVVADYLNRDNSFASDDSRYLLHYDHQSRWNDHLRGGLDFTEVSDDNYLNDIGSDVASATSNRLERNGTLAWLDEDWQLSGAFTDYQVFGSGQVPHRQLPQLDLSYRPQQRWLGLAADLQSQFVYFDANSNSQPSASRLHFEPGLTLPFYAPAGSLALESRLYQTNYRQQGGDAQLGQSINRTLPFFRADGQLNFDRVDRLGDFGYTQTLEPRLQYLYVPYKNQDDIALYDSDLLPPGYDGLFRTRRYSGYDRISDANQTTAGITSRLLDSGNRERANFSVGQIFYLKQARVGLDPTAAHDPAEDASDVASDLNLWLGNDWYLQNRLQLDSWGGGLLYNTLLADYRRADGSGVQFSYRDLPQITATDELKQAGVALSWPLTDNWLAITSYQRDLILNRSIESYVALQYENCCYALQFGYQRNIKTRFADDGNSVDSARFDGGVFFQIALRGIGSSDNSSSELFKDTLFGRYDPYTLNN